MSDAIKTYLPPTPSEVFSAIMPTMADVDVFFEQISAVLKDSETAKSLLCGQRFEVTVTGVLYKSYRDEILNRFVEQGWKAEWAEWAIGQHVQGDTKPLYISFERKSHDQVSEALNVAEWALEAEHTKDKAGWFDVVMSDVRNIVSILKREPASTK